MHRPAVAAHTVTAVQRSREEHVLRTDDDCVVLGIEIPFTIIFSTHENLQSNFSLMPGSLVPKTVQLFQPDFRIITRLLYKRPHRQTVDQSTRPGVSMGTVRMKH